MILGDQRETVKIRFDFIVVGAGSSGCALAHRLAQLNPDADVALLEAGERDWRPMVHVPLGFSFLMGDTPANWGYRTEPIPELSGRRLDLPRGKMLGGTSSLNGMVYVRGQREDFDGWAAAGNRGWAYEDVLPYFKRSERHHRGGDAFHGGGGPLFVTPVTEPLPITLAFIEAASRYGLNRNTDFNGARQAGVGLFEANIRRGRRHSAARAFLGKAARPANLTVITRLNVIALRWQGKRVTGLRGERRGKPLDLTATSEVILSAGVFNTPKILELSGVGDPDRLTGLDIPVVSALRGVGENLQDHLNVYVESSIKEVRTYHDYVSSWRVLPTVARWFFGRRGILGNPAAVAGAFFSTDPADERPDTQVHFAAAASRRNERDWMIPIPATTASVCFLRPGSRGSCHIHSRDAKAAPHIQPNYMNTEEDRIRTIKAIRILRDILATSPFADHVEDEIRPGKSVSSDEDLLDYIRNDSDTVHHGVGTCKMGNDDESVVDDRLRVQGAEGLRVADGSIMPTITSGNTHAACVMIGEKAADLISTA
jgi:choline dehydrogenase